MRYVSLMATVGLLVFAGLGAAQSEPREAAAVSAPQRSGTSARGASAPGAERDGSPGARRGGRLSAGGTVGGAAGARDRSSPRMPGSRGEAAPPAPRSGTRARPPVVTAGRESSALAAVGSAVVVVIVAGLWLLFVLALVNRVRTRQFGRVLLCLSAMLLVLWAALAAVGVAVAIVAGVWLLFVLALLNWVRTRRFGVVLLGLSAISLVLWPALRSGTVSLYPIIISVMGLSLLLIRVWPRWRLLRGPLPRRPASRVPAIRGVIVARRWPLRREKGMTVYGVLVGFSMVALVSTGAVSGIGRAVQVTAASRQSLVASALLEGEMERARAGAIPWERLEEDLAARARRLLPDAEAAVVVSPQVESGVRQVDLVVSWRGMGKPARRARLTGMVYALSRGEEQ